MKKVVNKIIVSLLGATLATGVGVALAQNSSVKEANASNYSVNSVPTTIDCNDTTATNIRSYYSNLNSLSTTERQGTNLLKNLKPILKNNQKYFSYGSRATTAVWQAYEIVDRDWTMSPASSISGYNPSTKIISNYTYGSSNSNPYVHALYVNRNVTNQTRAWGNHNQDQWGINQEHVWAKSCGFNNNSPAAGARGDLMHLWAGNGKVNGTYHSNYYYGYVDKTKPYENASSYASTLSGNLKGTSKTLGGTYSVFEPQDSDKGDIARAIFYMVARYNYLSGSDSDGIDAGNPNLEIVNVLNWAPGTSYTSSTSTKGQMGILQDLLEWNRLDQPDEWEIHRNNLLYNNFTNNRNPFIDFPEWAEYIWGKSVDGSYSSTSTGYATPSSDNINTFSGGGGGGSDPVAVTGVSLDKNAIDIAVGGSTTLYATVDPTNATNTSVTWTSSNPSAATVNNGVVSVPNNATVGATSTITVTTVDGSFTDTCTVTVVAGGGGTSGSKSIVYSDTFSPAFPTSSSAVHTSDTSHTDSTCDLTFKEQGIYKGSSANYLMFAQDKGFLYNTDDLGTIDSVSVTYSSGTSTSGKIGVYFGNSEQSTYTTTNNQTIEGLSQTDVFNNSTEGNGYFQVSSSNKNVQITQIDIEYHTESQSKTLTAISLDPENAPQEFIVGDIFSSEGLIVTASYSDGTSAEVEGFTVTAPDMSTSSVKDVLVEYTEGSVTKSDTYEITVSEKVLSSISVSVAPTKTTYVEGEHFDPAGLVITRNYSNADPDTYTYANHTSEFTFSPSISTALTTSNVSVTITYGGKSTSQAITVNAAQKTLSSISVQTAPIKTTYVVDEYFDPTGLVITRNYSDSTSDTYTYAGHTSEFSFNPTTSTALNTGHTSVTITYGGKTCNQAITVNSSGGGSSTEEGSVTAASGALQGWTAVGTGSAYADGSVKFDGSGDNVYKLDIFTGDASDNMINLEVTINGKINGTPTSANSYKVEALDSSGNVLASNTKTGADIVSTSYGDAVFTMSSNLSGCTGIRITYVTKGGGNWGVKVVSWVATYSTGGGEVTSITASVLKTFYVGETISVSDITVKDNNNHTVSGFTFANDGYRFTFSDAASGGSLTDKTFTNSISYSTLTCSLTVRVQRKEHGTPETSSVTLVSSSVFSGIGGGNNNLKSGTVSYDGITYDYYKSYYYSGGSSISFGNASAQAGYVKNQTAFATGISDATVTSTGRAVNIRYSVDGNTWVLKASADPSTYNYKYIKVDCINNTGSNYSNITQISITLKGEETPNNVANYIMYEDTNNQCSTKYSIAKGYFNNMSSAQKTEFMTSSDYVISTARERFEAWAKHHGETIQSQGGDYVISRNIIPFGSFVDNDNTKIIAIVSIVSLIGVSTIGGYFFLKKRKEQ